MIIKYGGRGVRKDKTGKVSGIKGEEKGREDNTNKWKSHKFFGFF